MALSPITLTYSSVDDLNLQLDAYIPVDVRGPRPAVLFLHGGGCFSGTRRNEGVGYFSWIESSYQTVSFLESTYYGAGGALDRGYIFITADYRLLHPFTGLHQLEDVQNLFHFLSTEFNSQLPANAAVTLDINAIAVFGESGGGYIARMAALYAVPRPVALISYYGMGGDMFSDFWFRKFEPQAIPRKRITEFLDSEPTKESSLPIYLEDGFFTDALRRTDAFCWISQNGLFTDYLTGIHGLSKGLMALPSDQRATMIPTHMKKAFPELFIDAIPPYPPTLFVHSTEDSIVPPSESLNTYEQLKQMGIRAELCLIGGAKHGLVNPDGTPVVGAEAANESVFAFIESVLRQEAGA